MNQQELDSLNPGFYHLYSDVEEEPTLVQLYYSNDVKSMVFGFNTHDGSGLLPINDVTDNTRVVPLIITEDKE